MFYSVSDDELTLQLELLQTIPNILNYPNKDKIILKCHHDFNLRTTENA